MGERLSGDVELLTQVQELSQIQGEVIDAQLEQLTDQITMMDREIDGLAEIGDPDRTVHFRQSSWLINIRTPKSQDDKRKYKLLLDPAIRLDELVFEDNKASVVRKVWILRYTLTITNQDGVGRMSIQRYEYTGTPTQTQTLWSAPVGYTALVSDDGTQLSIAAADGTLVETIDTSMLAPGETISVQITTPDGIYSLSLTNHNNTYTQLTWTKKTVESLQSDPRVRWDVPYGKTWVYGIQDGYFKISQRSAQGRDISLHYPLKIDTDTLYSHWAPVVMYIPIQPSTHQPIQYVYQITISIKNGDIITTAKKTNKPISSADIKAFPIIQNPDLVDDDSIAPHPVDTTESQDPHLKFFSPALDYGDQSESIDYLDTRLYDVDGTVVDWFYPDTNRKIERDGPNNTGISKARRQIVIRRWPENAPFTNIDRLNPDDSIFIINLDLHQRNGDTRPYYYKWHKLDVTTKIEKWVLKITVDADREAIKKREEYDKIWNRIRRRLALAQQDFKDWLDRTGEAIGAKFDAIKKNILDWIKNDLNPKIEALKKKVKDKLKYAKDRTIDQIEDFKIWLKDAIDELMWAVWWAIATILQKVKEIAPEVLEDLKDELKIIVENIKKEIAWWPEIRDLIERFKEWFDVFDKDDIKELTETITIEWLQPDLYDEEVYPLWWVTTSQVEDLYVYDGDNQWDLGIRYKTSLRGKQKMRDISPDDLIDTSVTPPVYTTSIAPKITLTNADGVEVTIEKPRKYTLTTHDHSDGNGSTQKLLKVAVQPPQEFLDVLQATQHKEYLKYKFGYPMADTSYNKVTWSFGEPRAGHDHEWIDIGTQWYPAEIVATEDSTVVEVLHDPTGYGHYVVTEFTKYGETFRVVYAHLNKNSLGTLKKWDSLTRWFVFGKLETDPTKRWTASGSHLHLEIRIQNGAYKDKKNVHRKNGWEPVDPETFYDFDNLNANPQNITIDRLKPRQISSLTFDESVVFLKEIFWSGPGTERLIHLARQQENTSTAESESAQMITRVMAIAKAETNFAFGHTNYNDNGQRARGAFQVSVPWWDQAFVDEFNKDLIFVHAQLNTLGISSGWLMTSISKRDESYGKHTTAAAQVDLCTRLAHIHRAGTARKNALLNLGSIGVADLEDHVAKKIQICKTVDANWNPTIHTGTKVQDDVKNSEVRKFIDARDNPDQDKLPLAPWKHVPEFKKFRLDWTPYVLGNHKAKKWTITMKPHHRNLESLKFYTLTYTAVVADTNAPGGYSIHTLSNTLDASVFDVQGRDITIKDLYFDTTPRSKVKINITWPGKVTQSDPNPSPISIDFER